MVVDGTPIAFSRVGSGPVVVVPALNLEWSDYPLEPLLEFDCSEHPIRMAVLRAPIVQRDGWVEIPDGPGLGIDIDRAALERFRVA